ncbi:MAG: hypothetical protein ABEK59_10255 [Halobacteria archaeon]
MGEAIEAEVVVEMVGFQGQGGKQVKVQVQVNDINKDKQGSKVRLGKRGLHLKEQVKELVKDLKCRLRR